MLGGPEVGNWGMKQTCNIITKAKICIYWKEVGVDDTTSDLVSLNSSNAATAYVPFIPLALVDSHVTIAMRFTSDVLVSYGNA